MKTSKPFISIIIPTKNEEKRLGYCLPSLLNQTFNDFEIIIVDDPETDDQSEFFINGLNDKRIQYLVHKKGLRVPAKRNLGAKKAVGEYLYFIDADMEFPKNTLQSIHDQILAEKADLVFVAERTPGKEWLARMKDFEKQIIQQEISLTAARIYNAKLFKKTNGYNEELVANEEMEISDRLIDNGASYTISKAEVNHYETNGQNILSHLKKKYKYGTTVSDYYEKRGEEELGKKRTGVSRFIYFTSPKTWKNPLVGIQFVIFKFIELSVLATGLIIGKIFNKRAITTR